MCITIILQSAGILLPGSMGLRTAFEASTVVLRLLLVIRTRGARVLRNMHEKFLRAQRGSETAESTRTNM